MSLRQKGAKVIQWIEEGESWLERGREILSEIFSESESDWHDEPASDRQLTLLSKYNVTPRMGLKKGEADSLIKEVLRKARQR